MITRPKYRVLVTDYVWPSTGPEREVLAGIGAEVIEAPDPSEDTLMSLAANADGIMTCFAQVTSKVVQAARQCMVISRYGVGVDNIAVETATEEGIVVTYVPDYCVDEVSDHVMALLLSWNRQIGFYDQVARQGIWSGTPSPIPLVRLRGQKLGIIGLGRIGRLVARKAQGFGLEVLGHDPYLGDGDSLPTGVKVVDLPTLLSESDYVTIHTPLNDATRGLISTKELSRMKPTAYIINCARGPIIDEAALYAALRDRRIAGAGLDVLEQAAPSGDNPLFQLDNVLVTPHFAFLSQQSVHELEVRTAQATVDVLQGRMPQFLVNPNVLPQARARLS
ncbi:MAG TPA: C-terminal binding protein [Dehalococcoidia bacterium]|nr:C-terminal binding protein [Dehalococcoidia bacterium]